MNCENNPQLTAGLKSQPEEIERRKPYKSPRLEVLGDVRDVTLGGSPGINDSGNPTEQQPL